ncbi:MAG TPA: PRC-barrel domain-containing protein [Anaerolineales bacterium]|nr:PRC-barrel domain-containing protein [Anaerolineales bacterium]
MIELKEGIDVFTPAGEEIGKINRFVLDPVTKEVTHIVVQKGRLLAEDKVVPFRMVSTGPEDQVVLDEVVGNFDRFPPFEEKYFVRADDGEDVISTGNNTHTQQNASTFFWYPSSVNIGYPAYELENPSATLVEIQRNIPNNTIVLREGAKVVSSDGKHVGDVERLFVEPTSKQATHFLISQGLLFKDRKLVPAHWVKSIDEDKVQLAVTSRLLERLPSYES